MGIIPEDVEEMAEDATKYKEDGPAVHPIDMMIEKILLIPDTEKPDREE